MLRGKWSLYLGLLFIGSKCIAQQQEQFQFHLEKGCTLFAEAKYSEALRFADTAWQLHPANRNTLLLKALCNLSIGNTIDGKQLLSQSIWLQPNKKAFDSLLNFIQNWKKQQPGVNLNDITTFANEQYANNNKQFEKINQYLNNAIEAVKKNNKDNAGQLSNLAFQQFIGAPDDVQYMKPVLMYLQAVELIELGEYKYARQLIQTAYTYFSIIPSAYMKVKIASQLADFYISENKFTDALLTIKAVEPIANKLSATFATTKGNLYFFACQAASNTNQLELLQRYAILLTGIRKSSADTFFIANGFNFLGNAFVQSTSPVSRKEAANYYNRAYQLALAGNLNELATNILSNLALSYWQQGDKEKAKKTYLDAIATLIAQKKYIEAELCYNNLGSLFYYENNFATAAEYFEQSVKLNEQFRNNYTGEAKMLFSEHVNGSYKFLLSCLTATKNDDKIFYYLNLERGRQLQEEIKETTSLKSISLNDFKKQLHDQEAAIFYAIIEGGVIVAQVVTKDKVITQKISNPTIWYNLKQKYLDRIKGHINSYTDSKGVSKDLMGNTIQSKEMAGLISLQDFDDIASFTRELIDQTNPEKYQAITKEFLTTYYQYLISPLVNDLQMYKKLIIFPDGILNYLPFAALQSPSTGKYLVEDFYIRFGISADLFTDLKKKIYPSSRKNLLAMGGAIYEEMKKDAEVLKTDADKVQLNIQLEEEVGKTRSMRKFFNQLGFGKMKYLEGTLKEVSVIAKNVPGTTIFTGNQMTENRIKEMSANNSLINYKIIHLATHGYALSDYPMMSGMAMCIFADPVGGEDGYLTAYEIARLKLQSDLVVMSACETALGKIYGGEGVVGLTGSLLKAGTKNVLVTLWPVNDYGTMNFMIGFYNGIYKEKKPTDEMVIDMQRRFIKGEFSDLLKYPVFWAPFIHIGQ